VIAALGEQVPGWRVGDAVVLGYMVDCTSGPVSKTGAARLRGATMPCSLAEFDVVPASPLVRKLASLSFVEAAMLPIAATTAWNAMVAANVRPGSTVALLGTAGVSLFALQFAKAAGARVIISSSSDEKLARARAMGADVTINYVTNPNWGEAILEATDHHGADLVVETVGGSTFSRSVNAAAYGGTVYAVGFIGGMDLSMPILPIMSKTLRINGSQTGSTANLVDATRAVSTARIKPVIDRVFSFDEAKDAYAFLAKAGHSDKVAIRLDNDHASAK
jgi:NADPH:quinone reductase-like Zn-dependent oxidoreductase